MWPNPVSYGFGPFTEDILNGKFRFCAVSVNNVLWS